MYHKSLDLVGAAVVASAAILLVLLDVVNPVLRTVFGAPLVLLLPGYTLAAALFPNHTLRGPERVVLSLGVSLVVTALLGFVLNLSPAGLTPVAWVVWLGSLTLAASGVAMLRRPGYLRLDRPPVYTGLDLGSGVLFGLAALLVILSLQAVRSAALQQDASDTFTELWVLPNGDAASNALRIGVHNVEGRTLSYGVKVVTGDTTLNEWPSITLQPAETWQVLNPLPNSVDTTEPVEVFLYRVDQPNVIYRRGIFWPHS